ncbi:MAG: HAD-IC family P-type ATPase, partial [Actinomycetota bacterium]
ETLGSTTVICSDKTGTLTENQMTVRAATTGAGRYRVSGGGYDPEGEILDVDGNPVDPSGDAALAWTLGVAALCNDAAITHGESGWQVMGDPTEGALVTVALKAGVDVAEARSRVPRTWTITFSSDRQYMATAHEEHLIVREFNRVEVEWEEHEPGATGPVVVLAKGATERILGMCWAALGHDGRPRELDHDEVLREAEELAAGGLRVLATAMGRFPDAERVTPESIGGRLALTGLVAMLDPPRPAAIHAVASCHEAGIKVTMITGDHAATAAAIADQVGLARQGQPPRVLTGAELEAMPDAELGDAVENTDVFARVSPAQKLRLVDAFQSRGHVVAMTGDGVNDAPALRQADIGVAMGMSGTEVAKEAADMVLTDDNFATIEAAVEEGRGVFDNLTKFIVWTLPTNAGEGLVIMSAIVLGLSLPILPVQILWINMTTAVLLGLMLAFEPNEAGIMSRPPRDPASPLFSSALVVRILLVSTLMVAGAWWVFGQEVAAGDSVHQARTAAMNLFVVVEAFYLFSCRSLTHSAASIGFFSNRWLVVGVAAQAVLQVAITYLPVMNTVFSTAPIGLATWLRILTVGVVVSVVVAVDKGLRRRSRPVRAPR